MRLFSSAFADRDAIPRKYTCDGEDLSPPLAWTDVPAAAASPKALGRCRRERARA
jgi:phosphatidylethanolamine-binding protein (PEBP) family uncharacterized protein